MPVLPCLLPDPSAQASFQTRTSTRCLPRQEPLARARVPALRSQVHPATIQKLEPMFHSGIAQRVPMRCKGVGNDDLRSFTNVILVNSAQDLRMAQCATAVPGIVKLWNPPSFDLRSRRAVNQDPVTYSDPIHQSIISAHLDLSRYRPIFEQGQELPGFLNRHAWPEFDLTRPCQSVCYFSPCSRSTHPIAQTLLWFLERPGLCQR